MDYYTKFSSEADSKVQELVKERDTLTKMVGSAEKNLADEKQTAQDLRSRIAILKEKLTSSLTDDKRTFEEFKSSLEKLNYQLETSAEMCQMLEDEVIPQKKKELQETKITIKRKLDSYLLSCKPVLHTEIRDLLDVALKEREAFVADFSRIFQDAGLNPIMPPSNRERNKLYEVLGVRMSLGEQRKQIQVDKTPEQPVPTMLLTGTNEQTIPEPEQSNSPDPDPEPEPGPQPGPEPVPEPVESNEPQDVLSDASQAGSDGRQSIISVDSNKTTYETR